MAVEDSATKELMTRFYVNAVDGTLTKAEALRRAQLALAEQGFGLAQWAPFVLDGDAGPSRSLARVDARSVAEDLGRRDSRA